MASLTCPLARQVLYPGVMDIARPDLKKKKMRQYAIWAGIAAVLLTVAVIAVWRLKPAAPTVDRSTIWPDTVKRGDLTIQVRGSTGSLVPREDSIELIPAQTDATVVRIIALPGAKVTPDTIVMDMSDPQLEQQLLSAQSALKGAEADYKSLQATLNSTLMDKKIAAAQVNAAFTTDQRQAQTDEALNKLGVVSGIVASASKNTAEQLTAQKKLSEEQLDVNQKAIEVQLASAQTKVEQAKAQLDLYEKQSAALHVRAGISGVLAQLPVPLQVGQHVTAGTSVAKVIQLDKLKAALQIAETQARDIQLGQPASIDTHNGIIPGHVSRIDPSVLNGTVTVDVALDGPLPPGARPDLSVDGSIDLARLHDVLYVGRPALGNENSTLSLFKVDPDGKGAVRVPVKVGRNSVNEIQILEGLKEGDTVILSDMSREDAVDRIRLE
jgi:HlyD family secretion protein